MVDVVKASGAVDAAYGGPRGIPVDPLDAVLGGVATAFGEKHQPTSLAGRMKDAAVQVQEAPASEDTEAAARERLANLSPEELRALEDAYGEKLDAELNEAATLADANPLDDVADEDLWVADYSEPEWNTGQEDE
jgi:hypothetical protein